MGARGETTVSMFDDGLQSCSSSDPGVHLRLLQPRVHRKGSYRRFIAPSFHRNKLLSCLAG